MKKVGILTLYPSYNYGGMLQCMAMYKLLSDLDVEPILISRPQYIQEGLLRKIARKVLMWLPGQNVRNIRSNWRDTKLHKPFFNTYVKNQTKLLWTQEELKSVCASEGLNAVVVGSDQVWRFEYINDGYYQNYFLDFVPENVDKIAMSASFGKDSWNSPESVKENVRKLLRRFKAISTREASGVDICANEFGLPSAYHTLDPTMLVDKSFYDFLISLSPLSTEESRLVTYILDETEYKSRIIQQISHQRNAQPKHLYGYKTKKFISMSEWLKSIKSADFVVTDSFHGMVFSIIFRKNFIVIGNAERGLSRFSSLLDMLGLGNRLLLSDEIMPMEDIDYSKVEDILNEQSLIGKKYLREALQND